MGLNQKLKIVSEACKIYCFTRHLRLEPLHLSLAAVEGAYQQAVKLLEG